MNFSIRRISGKQSEHHEEIVYFRVVESETQHCIAACDDEASAMWLVELLNNVDKVLIGGNHLAGFLGKNPPSYKVDCTVAMEHYGPNNIFYYEIWCCWKTIKELADVMGEKNGQQLCD